MNVIMEVTVITEFGRTISSDMRYRRSERVTDALAFQCAHLQEQLGLEAVVVSDDVGTSWVGAGDLALCRVLSRSAPALAMPSHAERDLQVKTLRSLRHDLRDGDVATAALSVPNSARRIFVSGVGRSRLLENAVTTTAAGSSRILGYDRPRRRPVEIDTRNALSTALMQAWQTLFSAGVHDDAAIVPRNWLGFADDRRYRDIVTDLMSPVVHILQSRGVLLEDLWSQYRFRSNEVELTDGLYLRTFRIALRDVRLGLRIGHLELDLFHRHDRLAVPVCPRIRLQWG